MEKLDVRGLFIFFDINGFAEYLLQGGDLYVNNGVLPEFIQYAKENEIDIDIIHLPGDNRSRVSKKNK